MGDPAVLSSSSNSVLQSYNANTIQINGAGSQSSNKGPLFAKTPPVAGSFQWGGEIANTVFPRPVTYDSAWDSIQKLTGIDNPIVAKIHFALGLGLLIGIPLLFIQPYIGIIVLGGSLFFLMLSSEWVVCSENLAMEKNLDLRECLEGCQKLENIISFLEKGEKQYQEVEQELKYNFLMAAFALEIFAESGSVSNYSEYIEKIEAILAEASEYLVKFKANLTIPIRRTAADIKKSSYYEKRRMEPLKKRLKEIIESVARKQKALVIV